MWLFNRGKLLISSHFRLNWGNFSQQTRIIMWNISRLATQYKLRSTSGTSRLESVNAKAILFIDLLMCRSAT